MRFAALALLVATVAGAGGRVYDRACEVASRRSERGGIFCATAEAEPDAGQPFLFTMGVAENGAVACTGADLLASYNGISRAVTVTRSTAAWCTKGNETKDIANGDLVLVAANKPRWMPGGEGDGGMGVAVWASRTNYLLRSQEFDNAAWRKVGCVAGVCADNTGITVTANAAVAPDGTMTADEVACGSSCYVTQDVCPADRVVRAVYLRLAPLSDGGVNNNATDFMIGANFTTVVPVTSASWTRMTHDVQADNAIYWGVYHYLTTTLPAATFYVWQADCQRNTEQATHPLPPPITTVAATVTTADEVVQVSNYTPAWADMTWSATLQAQDSPADGVVFTTGDALNGDALFVTTKLTCQQTTSSVTNSITSGGSLGTNAQRALTCTYNGTGQTEACVGNSCADAGAPASVLRTTTSIGSTYNGVSRVAFIGGVVKELRAESSATRDIYLLGDSIVFGFGATPGSEPQFVIHETLGNAAAISNQAISGTTVEQCMESWDAVLARVAAAPSAGRTDMMVQSGTNSASPPGDGGSAVGNAVHYLQGMLLSGRDAGVRVLWSTITPRCDGEASYIAAVNTEMRSWCTSNGFAYADTHAVLEDPGAPGCLLPAYDLGDGIHLTDAGTYAETQEWIRAGRWAQ